MGVGGGAILERESAVEDRFEAACGDQLEHRGEFGFCAHVGAKDGKLAAEEKPEIDFGVVTGGGSAGDQATAPGEARHAIVPGGGADVFEDDVHSALGCE